ncbi:MAG: redoxin family protein, partial [Firmicutes bacterium]|nr:redoxin family protein [Bacillota bacterium]
MRNILRKPFSLLAVVSCLGLVMALSLGCGGGGDTTSSTVPTNGAPRITVDLGAQSSVTVGADLTLVVEATGTPAPTFQWRKSGQPLAGQTAKSLTLKSVQMSENGATYDVVVSNTVGSVTSSTTTLQVKAAPSASDISGVDSTGTAVKLSDYKGSVILLDISAEWCPPCNADAVPLEQLYQKYKVRGLKVLTVLAQNN